MKQRIFIVIALVFSMQLFAQENSHYLTRDGAWCWFSDSRAIIFDNVLYTGWVKANGTIEALSMDLVTGSKKPYELYYQLERDDHNNPAFIVSESGDVLAMYTRHSKKDLFINRLKVKQGEDDFNGAQLIHPMSQEELEKFPKEHVTYANPYCLKQEDNRLYCFGRWTGYKPNIMWSDDDGESWSKSKVFITNYPFDGSNRPYVKYHSNGESKIHMVFTDGHPRNEPTNSVYYACYENGAFYRANNEQICKITDIPFEPKDASVVYTSNKKEGRAWIADIAEDEQGNPVLLYTKSPTEDNHEYWYARYTKEGWVSRKICDSGKWFPQTPEGKVEPEPHYFGGMTVHPKKANVVYLSRQINGVFEIERWETSDMGKTWISKAITQNSTQDNVRPYIPRGLSSPDPELVIWMENQKYIHYTNYQTAIKYLMLND
ncbi:MAG: BNR repeat-containing protein [Carboxylicivirga sp.]|nr:BNR repeat-containing protein [Carboxylicivirga sp.]